MLPITHCKLFTTGYLQTRANRSNLMYVYCDEKGVAGCAHPPGHKQSSPASAAVDENSSQNWMPGHSVFASGAPFLARVGQTSNLLPFFLPRACFCHGRHVGSSHQGPCSGSSSSRGVWVSPVTKYDSDAIAVSRLPSCQHPTDQRTRRKGSIGWLKSYHTFKEGD